MGNGLHLGWPPFNEFKKEMVELLDESNKPLKSEIHTIKGSLLSHIQKTNAHIQKTNAHIQKTNDSFKSVKKSLSTLEKHLSNHVTDTNKKIDSMRKETNKKFGSVNTKLDQIIKNQKKSK